MIGFLCFVQEIAPIERRVVGLRACVSVQRSRKEGLYLQEDSEVIIRKYTWCMDGASV